MSKETVVDITDITNAIAADERAINKMNPKYEVYPTKVGNLVGVYLKDNYCQCYRITKMTGDRIYGVVEGVPIRLGDRSNSGL